MLPMPSWAGALGGGGPMGAGGTSDFKGVGFDGSDPCWNCEAPGDCGSPYAGMLGCCSVP